MLPRFWLLTILASVALGVPVPHESVIPSIKVHDTKPSNTTKLPLDKANELSWHLKSGETKVGTKTTLDEQGSPSLGAYSARGTGVSRSVTSGGSSSVIGASQHFKEKAKHDDQEGGIKGREIREQPESHGSGSTTGSTSSSSSDGTTTGAITGSKGIDGTVTGSERTTRGTTIGKGTTGSNGDTTLTSKHKKRLRRR
ncbi:hypothetical protein IMSHALPRED_010245 [Imshaugia aleurites]|uniref:Uncharacterized protein n=1 Tax=Imshaugia aleurites TaxID=172621 RepID=A0A8H3G646_9LECA|nr:hypothetical protein IMSHALPRED_010245 [Imshaugia aleurites]